jgi:hypothetical protein
MNDSFPIQNGPKQLDAVNQVEDNMDTITNTLTKKPKLRGFSPRADL